MASVYAQSSGKHSTNTSTWTAIPGLKIELPEGVGDIAIVTLNVPAPWATGNNYPGGVFAIAVDGKRSPVLATFSYSEEQGNSRIPTTLVVGVPLAAKNQTVHAEWQNVRGSAVHIDSPATLNAIY